MGGKQLPIYIYYIYRLTLYLMEGEVGLCGLYSLQGGGEERGGEGGGWATSVTTMIHVLN